MEGLRWTTRHAFEGSPFYHERFEKAGVHPRDIARLEDLPKLPFTTAEDLREGYPFPLLSVPIERVVRIHASSGTTGKRKVLGYTEKDLRDWSDMFARCYEMAGLTREDRVQIAVGYGLWTAGVGFQSGCERFGAMAVPVGPGNLDMHCEIMQDLQTTVFCCTASMGLLMAEEVKRRDLREKIRLRKVIFGAERHSEAMRRNNSSRRAISPSYSRSRRITHFRIALEYSRNLCSAPSRNWSTRVECWIRCVAGYCRTAPVLRSGKVLIL